MPKHKRKMVVKAKPRRTVARRSKPQAPAAVPAKPQRTPTEALTPGSKLEQVLIVGDLSQLSPEERIDYYRRMCESLGLNPLTRPFEYVLFKTSEESTVEKLSLYARKDCAEQLRKIHHIGVRPPLRRSIDLDRKVVMVEADLFDAHGKTDTATGVVSLRKWNKDTRQWGEMSNTEYCNAIMKCETKAKRRGTLSICGLSMLDESELDTMTVLGGVSRDGRIYRYDHPIGPPQEPPLLEEGRAHGHAKGSRKAEQAEATLANSEELDRILATETDAAKLMKLCGLSKADAEKTAAKNKKKQESQKAPEPSGPSSPATPAAAEPRLEVETVGPDEFIIRGDVTQVYSMVEHYCQFRDGWWRANLDALKQMQALENRFKFRIDVLPAAGKKEKPATKPSASRKAASEPPSGHLVIGTVDEANEGTSRSGKMLHVKLRVNPNEALKIGVFNSHLFPFLQKGARVEAFVETKGDYRNITGLKRVRMANGQVIEFDDDGKTPALSVDREPGMPKR